MTDLDFPNSPTINDIYTGTNGVVYTFDGVKWIGSYDSRSALWMRDESTSTISPVQVDDKLSVQTYVIEDLGAI